MDKQRKGRNGKTSWASSLRYLKKRGNAFSGNGGTEGRGFNQGPWRACRDPEWLPCTWEAGSWPVGNGGALWAPRRENTRAGSLSEGRRRRGGPAVRQVLWAPASRAGLRAKDTTLAPRLRRTNTLQLKVTTVFRICPLWYVWFWNTLKQELLPLETPSHTPVTLHVCQQLS